ncbi:MAG: copper resistance protein CopC [Actinobacteria bacterium]|nr:copper resistance protein CopC [Actinomycetota bacterium]
MTRLPRRLVATAIAACATALLTLGSATPATAHNSQIGSSPDAGAILDAAPAKVSVRFDAALMDIGEALVVRAADGTIVSTGIPTIKGNAIRTDMRTDVPAGEYTVAYRIVSKDGHPVTATFAYTLTSGSVTASAATAPTPQSSPAPAAASEDPPTTQGDGPGVVIYVLISAALAGTAIALVARSRR